jgi:hypothetical protein
MERVVGAQPIRVWLPEVPMGENVLSLAEGQGGWKQQLIRNKGSKGELGGPKPILANAITAFRFAPLWDGVVGFDEFALMPVIRKPAVGCRT